MSSPPTIQSATVFTPRKEFVRVQRHTKNSFALLALSGPNCVRLRSFSAQTIRSIRRVLEQYAPILSVSEDIPNNLCEYVVDKRPWANPRSVPSEKLLVDILGAVYMDGHTYLATTDYGKEADDRLVMIFSKTEPALSSMSKSSSALQTPTSIARNESSLENLPMKRVPFAISFSSSTTLRVISPPLHLTPAILQACRGAWPRGVISEKTVYGNSYEFKLKGYGLFEQDTFANDSLQHVVALLSSLDAHSFSLLASVSLTNHSRTKDLWLFTAPSSDVAPSDEPTSEANTLRRYSFPAGHVDPELRKQTEHPSGIPHSPHTGNHVKSSSDGFQRQVLPSTQQPNVLRKVSPRVQIPIDVRNSDPFQEDNHVQNRGYLPSVISVGVVDMTGVGSGRTAVLHEDSNGLSVQHDTVTPVPVLSTVQQTGSRSPGRPVSGRPLSSSVSGKHRRSQNEKDMYDIDKDTIPLLEAFRESSMTSDTELTREIPIKWTGPMNENMAIADQRKEIEIRITEARIKTEGQTLPTPIAEEESVGKTTAGQENEPRVEASETTEQRVGLQKSEKALAAMIRSTSPKEKDRVPATITPGGNGKGWVLVNVEDSPSSSGRISNEGSTRTIQQLQPKPASPEAKAIVLVDVLNSKAKTENSNKDGDLSVKRLFSLSQKNNKKGT